MRIINRGNVPWFLFVMVATIAATWIYLGNFAPARLPQSMPLPGFLVQPPSGHHAGGTPVGLVLGSIAFAIFIFAAVCAPTSGSPFSLFHSCCCTAGSASVVR